MRVWRKIVDFMEHGRPVPPPAAPPPQGSFESTPFQLFVPFAIEEWPRIFLRMLEQVPELGDDVRHMIRDWVDEYDNLLMDWLKSQYGPGVVAVADSITKNVFETQKAAAEQGLQHMVDEQIQNLEEQFREDDSNG